MQFSEFSLSENLLKGIAEAGYSECTEVQEETLALTLSGKDVFVQSQTGTGKTAAFLISLFELMERSTDNEKAIVIVPTRELALQIEDEARLLALYMDFAIASVFGGVGYFKQEKALAKGVDVLIGTPGRILDLSEKRVLNLHLYNYVVIDEADRMFDMGFVGDVRRILGRMQRKNIRQTMLFSATLSIEVRRLAASYMNEPEEVVIEPEHITVSTINQQLYHVGSREKMKLLLGLLQKYQPASTLIFANTKQMCEEVAVRLRMNGYDVDYLTGDLPQSVRQNIIDKFKQRQLPILVATDVAGRGLHIDDLELVVNYDIPQHCENYVHRIGRTARVGKSGLTIMLACERNIEFLSPIEKFIGMKIPASVADEELYAEDKSAGKRHRRFSRNVSHQREERKPSHNRRRRHERNIRKDHAGKTVSHTRPLTGTKAPYQVKNEPVTNSSQTTANNAQENPHKTSPQQTPKRKPGFFARVITVFKGR